MTTTRLRAWTCQCDRVERRSGAWYSYHISWKNDIGITSSDFIPYPELPRRTATRRQVFRRPANRRHLETITVCPVRLTQDVRRGYHHNNHQSIVSPELLATVQRDATQFKAVFRLIQRSGTLSVYSLLGLLP